MPFALIGIGLLLFVAAYHNNVSTLGSQIYSDIAGSKGFVVWVVALFIVGALGYVPVFKNVSRAFLVLILAVMFLTNKGFFAQFTAALGIGQSSDSSSSDGTAQPATPATGATAATPISGT